MSSSSHSIQRIARVSIEFTTAFHIGSGAQSGASDAGVVCDANGLPTLPGSTIQGVLRQSCEDLGYDADEWFGFGAEKKHAAFNNGRSSRLAVSWGLIHDQQNHPVEGLIDDSMLQSDLVLLNAAEPMVRDHVRMTHRKVADVEENGKFDDHAVAAGHRFTFELRLGSTTSSAPDDDGKWETLLQLLAHPLVRFGGKTRRGYGNFKVLAIARDRFDLIDKADRDRYLEWPASLAQAPQVSQIPLEPGGSDLLPMVDYTLTITPEVPWMIGGGEDENADSAPVRATRIVWNDNSGQPITGFLVPGTAVKGALAHRTCFHANRLASVYADLLDEQQIKDVTGSNNAVVRALFGEMVDHENDLGTPGCVMVDDFIFATDPAQLPPQNHVAIDPFTGGAKDTALFQDRPLLGGMIEIPVFLRGNWERFTECEILDGRKACPKKAFEAALADLCGGHLALGAHASRGYGYFTGQSKTQLTLKS